MPEGSVFLWPTDPMQGLRAAPVPASCVRVCLRNVRVSIELKARRGVRIDSGMLSRQKSRQGEVRPARDLVVLRQRGLPPQSEMHVQPFREADVVLPIRPPVPLAQARLKGIAHREQA